MIGTSILPPVTTPTVTLVDGTCFAISATTGEMAAEQINGLYFADTRFIAGWRLLVDGAPPDPLSAQPRAPYEAVFLGRRHGGEGSKLLVQRRRMIGRGMREDLTLRNLNGEDTACLLVLEIETDFADLFSVKSGTPTPLGEVTWSVTDPGSPTSAVFTASAASQDRSRGVQVRFDGAVSSAPGQLTVYAVVPARGTWTATIEVNPIIDGRITESDYPRDTDVERSAPAERYTTWRQSRPLLEAIGTPDASRSPTSGDLVRILDRSVSDLGALRVPDLSTPGMGSKTRSRPGDHYGDIVIAAGAPWFMTLFGRDSLLAAWMALPIDPDLAMSTLHALAARQGTKVDPLSEEEPGRILHEVRHGPFPLSPGSSIYYGTIDATALFCMLVGELHRWGRPIAELEPLLPHVDRALAWIAEYGDRDRDGFVEYKRATDRGILNQGWKDSDDSIRFADGRTATAPIALAEVQGYVYAAYVARSELAVATGDTVAAARWADRAATLRRAFNQAFWIPERGYFALALDADKRQVDSLTSNLGHCLWTGLIDPEYAEPVADHLMSERMFTGWGIRTMAQDMAAYDPVSYHNGSVWPHDTAICVAGLARAGFTDHARTVALGLLDAAVAFGGRLPELFCGFDRREFAQPVGYPTACSPQAWAAASPLLLVRALLGFDPDIPTGVVTLGSDPPEELGTLEISNLPLAGERVKLRVQNRRSELLGLPDGVTVRPETALPERPRAADR